MRIYCANCCAEIDARLTNGAEIYPHRSDLHALPFWRCDNCDGFVGCHHKTKDRTQPLGCIPTPAMREGRKRLHAIIDPLWKDGSMSRKEVYRRMSDALGWRYHTAKTRSMAEIGRAIEAARALKTAVQEGEK